MTDVARAWGPGTPVIVAGRAATQYEVPCPDCGAPMVLVASPAWRRKRLGGAGTTHGFYYGCSTFKATRCAGNVGCHPDGTPAAIPADAETRKARARAHRAFDRLWTEGRMARAAAYKWLTARMGAADQVHIGAMNAEECDRVVMLVAQALR